MLDVLSFRVQLVQHHIGIRLVASGECNDFVELGHSLEETYGVGADCDVSLSCRPIFHLNRKHDIVWFCLIFLAVNNGLIDVQNQCLFVAIGLRRAEIHPPVLNIREGRRLDSIVIPEHLMRNNEMLERTIVLAFECGGQMREIVGLNLLQLCEIRLALEYQLAVTAGYRRAFFLKTIRGR